MSSHSTVVRRRLVASVAALAISLAGLGLVAAPQASGTGTAGFVYLGDVVTGITSGGDARGMGTGGIQMSRDGSTAVVSTGNWCFVLNVNCHSNYYVFTRPAGGWTAPATYATLPSTASIARTAQVAISPDGSTVALAYDPDQHDWPHGGVQVFTRPADGWAGHTILAPTAMLSPSDLTAGVQLVFGTSVAVANDVIAVGAPGSGVNINNSTDTSAGAVYVFAKPAGGWVDATQTAKLTPSTGVMTFLGSGLATDGTTIVAQPSFTYRDALFTFDKPAGGWANATENAQLAVPNVCQLCNTYGRDTIVDGAIFHSLGARPDATAVQVFVRPPTGWVSTATPTARLSFTHFGSGALPPAQFVAGDGKTVIVGGNTGADGSGLLSVYTKPAGGWVDMTESQTLTAPPFDTTNFGPPVGFAGAPFAPQQGAIAIGGGTIIVPDTASSAGIIDTMHVYEAPVIKGSLTVAPKPIVVGATTAAFTSTCRITFGAISTCRVVAKSGATVVATGVATPVTPASAVAVRTVVTTAGRTMLARSAGVLPITVTATITPVSGAALTAVAGDTLVAKTVKVTLASSILFASGSAKLTPAAVKLLKTLGAKVAGTKKATCDGYTDNQGSAAYNMTLGLKRAQAVCVVLRPYVKATLSRSFGATHPVASNATAAGRAKNRRVIITFAN